MERRFLIWKNPMHAMVTLVLLLMGLGMTNVYSASFVSASAMQGNGQFYLYRYLGWGVLGLGAMYVVGHYFAYKKLFALNRYIYWILLGLLIAVDLVGSTTKGAQRWLAIGGMSFQPSEFVKLGVLMLSAEKLGLMLKAKRVPDLLEKSVDNMFARCLVLAGLVFLQPDMGTAAIILAIVLVLYLVAGLPWKQVGVMLAVGAVSVVAMVAMAPYRMNRILVWLDPWRDAQGNGYQMVQSLTAIGSGGWFGSSVGMGFGKFFFLPEAHTDFAFAIWCQEGGFLMALLLIAIFIVLAGAMLRIAKHTTDERGYLLVIGATFLIVGQAIANMAMVCGLLPVIGVPLSFISYGGTSLVATLLTIGLVISVYRDEVQLAKHPPKPDIIAPRPFMRSRSSTNSAPLPFKPRGGWSR